MSPCSTLPKEWVRRILDRLTCCGGYNSHTMHKRVRSCTQVVQCTEQLQVLHLLHMREGSLSERASSMPSYQYMPIARRRTIKGQLHQSSLCKDQWAFHVWCLPGWGRGSESLPSREQQQLGGYLWYGGGERPSVHQGSSARTRASAHYSAGHSQCGPDKYQRRYQGKLRL